MYHNIWEVTNGKQSTSKENQETLKTGTHKEGNDSHRTVSSICSVLRSVLSDGAAIFRGVVVVSSTFSLLSHYRLLHNYLHYLIHTNQLLEVVSKMEAGLLGLVVFTLQVPQ